MEIKGDYFSFIVPGGDGKHVFMSFGFRVVGGARIYVGSNPTIICAFTDFCRTQSPDGVINIFEVKKNPKKRMEKLWEILAINSSIDCVIVTPSSADILDKINEIIDPRLSKLKKFASLNAGGCGNG